MRYKQPLKQILTTTRSCWDRPEIRPAVRQNFDKGDQMPDPGLRSRSLCLRN
jgi:hypothetical protein